MYKLYTNIVLYPRRILKEIEPWIDSKEIIVVTGMRRTGKTTLLKMIYDKVDSTNKVMLDMENIIEQRVFDEVDFNNVWLNLASFGIDKKKKAYIFIDEIQAAPEVVKVVKYLYDHYDVKFFLTGSSSFYFKNMFPESLAGRKVVFELFPLSFDEFLTFKELDISFPEDFERKESTKTVVLYEKVKKYYEEYLMYGGFPQVVLADDIRRKESHIKDIFSSYFEKDVRSLADFRSMKVFRELMFLILQRVGSKLNITRLSSELGVTRETVYSYLSFLEGTYFLFMVPPYSGNVDREVSGAKKIYVCDTGILNLFGRVGEGRLLENAVYLNLRKYGKLCYYQKRRGGEVDFVLPEAGIAFEVKSRGIRADYDRLRKLAERMGIDRYFVVSKDYVDEKGIIPACAI